MTLSAENSLIALLSCLQNLSLVSCKHHCELCTALCGVPVHGSYYVWCDGMFLFHFVIQKKVVLPLPSLEVLSDVSTYPNRHAGVMHVLETSVVMWLKQIKVSFGICVCTYII